MLYKLSFGGPDGAYVVSFDISLPNLIDSNIAVDFGESASIWKVETDERVQGIRHISGFTDNCDSSWFVLVLSEPSRIEYWGDRILTRVDHQTGV